MRVDVAMPTVAASVAPAAPIPFSHESAPAASGGGSLLVAALLLGAAFAALWLLKRSGWKGGALINGPCAQAPGVSVAQRLRLGPGCSAYVLHDGDERLLVVEARSGVQVAALRPLASTANDGAAP
ncbi:hypothetical protein ISN75_10360 [Dyella marensis]|uniref:hypothetical protein n=2 Tax=Dyella marensis TaxID=500610 RepID=UPI003389C1E7